jgi:hypothetical protein
MINVLIERANEIGDRWVAAALAGLIDAAALLAIVGIIWLAIRKWATPQLGYWLFLLVPSNCCCRFR